MKFPRFDVYCKLYGSLFIKDPEPVGLWFLVVKVVRWIPDSIDMGCLRSQPPRKPAVVHLQG